MSINTCSINSFTIDARWCRNNFQDLSAILHPQSAKKVSNGGWTKQRPPSYYRGINPPELDERPALAPVSEVITVSVDIFDMQGSAELPVTQRLDLVTITDIKFKTFNTNTVTDIFVESAVNVSISNFKVTSNAGTKIS